MVNLPPAIALPLYRMLFDEIAASPVRLLPSLSLFLSPTNAACPMLMPEAV
jgi:hypothetical protein